MGSGATTGAGFEVGDRDGYPFYSVLHHTKAGRDYRHLPNILFVHHGDLLAEMAREIRTEAFCRKDTNGSPRIGNLLAI